MKKNFLIIGAILLMTINAIAGNFRRVVKSPVINIFISPSGSDGNTGTYNKPFQSLEKAIAVIHGYADKKVCIQLRAGTYYLAHTIQLNAGDKLPDQLEITAFKNEKVFISAGKQLLLHWRPYRNGVFQAEVPVSIVFERLFINHIPQVLARYPNYDSTADIFHGTAEDAIAPERVKNWKNLVGGYIHSLHNGDWGSLHYRINGADQNGKLQLEGGWQLNREGAMSKKYLFVENIFEELDAPGEWYLNQDQHILYYYPPKGVNISHSLVEVSQLKNALVLSGPAGHPVSNVKIRNLDFVHTERSFMDTREPVVRSDWRIYRGGAILMDGTQNCSITDCSFTNLGGNAIMLSNYNRHDTISGNLIANIGAGGINIIGGPKAVRSPLFKYEAKIPYEQLDKTPGPLTNNYPDECLISNNLIHDIGDIEKQVAGVEIDMAANITVSHNSIYNTPRSGINIGDGCWGGHVIEYNDVFNTVLETSDHGAFNSWGRDRYWNADRGYMDSLVAVHPELILLDVQKVNTIRNNRFRCDHGWDIDLDDGSSNYLIYNNVCLSGGIKLREGFYRTVKNNIIINNAFHPHVWFKNSGDVFEGNIVSRKYAPIGINYWGKKVDHNVFPDTADLHSSQRNGTDMHSIVLTPEFANPVTGDYTMTGTAKSKALAIGFKNFSMDQFGVQKASLKRLAQHAPIPQLINTTTATDKSKSSSFLGGTIKNVDGLGERSAYGLPDETGVIVIKAGNNTLLQKSGLVNKDVIVSVEGKPVKNVQMLLEIYQAEKWKEKIALEIFRNQQKVKVMLQTR